MDLDDDGENEIFALAVGPSLSGSGGSSALLMKESGEVIQTFTLINPPVLVTDEIMNGYRELALVRPAAVQRRKWFCFLMETELMRRYLKRKP